MTKIIIVLKEGKLLIKKNTQCKKTFMALKHRYLIEDPRFFFEILLHSCSSQPETLKLNFMS